MADAIFDELCALAEREMSRIGVPGAAIGVVYGDREETAGLGINNAEHPLPVTTDTLFQIGSITKTVTATVAMTLVEQGQLELDRPVRSYLPSLVLADESVAGQVTMRHLLTHTGGWVGDYFDDTGSGDDALARIVANMASLPQLTPLGRHWSYNNAGFYLAGRVIEVLCGQPFETIVRERMLDPLGMSMSFFFAADCITHRVASGHEPDYTGQGPAQVARPWPVQRSAAPAGGIVSTVQDQLHYARFQMGDGTVPGGARLLRPESLAQMQTPTVPAANGEWIGLAWFLRDVDGVRLARHGGGTMGQQSLLMLAPARQFALSVLTNSARGAELHGALARHALKHYLGLEEHAPEPVAAEPAVLSECAGRYSSALSDYILLLEDDGLVVQVEPHGGFPTRDTPPRPAPPPMHVALCGPDILVVLDGPSKGSRGEFLRDDDGQIGWLRVGGRLHARRG